MKRWFAGIMLGMACFAGLLAQTTADSSDYQAGLLLIANAKTGSDYVEAVRYFEALAIQFPDQWIALYYAGLSYIHTSREVQEDNARDALLDNAQPFIDRAFILKPDEPEMHVLQAFLYQSRIQVNPEMRGLTYSRKADASLKKAVTLDPDNPRAYFLMGNNVYYTPGLLGGGAKNALPLFLKARDKYQICKAALPYYPSWGKSENQQMIRACSQAKNQPQ